jgi:DNA recombination protein RmuC
MNNTLIFLLFGALLVVGGGFYLLYRKLSELAKPSEDEGQKVLVDWLGKMQESLDRTRSTIDKQLDSSSKTLVSHLQSSNKAVNERLDKAAQVIAGVQKELGGLAETTGYIKDVYKVLQAPKLRGNIGEQILNDLLKQSIPHNKFSLQHTFRSGERVDALIETAEGKIPIDSKFPMESFKRYLSAKGEQKEREGKQFVRDVKKHINDIAKKYILPDEGTVDFAVMYIPSEPVAYEINTSFPEIMEYAHQRRITLVSPNQFFSFLRVIMIGFEKQQVGEKAKQILQALRSIKKESQKFEEDFDILQKHVSNAKTKADEAQTGFARLSSKIDNAQRISPPKEEPPRLS